jgi:aspartate-semialdehyde dehydrogenase
MKRKRLAVMGATGLVGQAMIQVLQEYKILYQSLRLFASAQSAGQLIAVGEEQIAVEELREEVFDGSLDYALFALEANFALQYAPLAASKGCTVIDNSRAFRMDPKTPLVVPEINLHTLKGYQGIIANPNCSTIQSVVTLAPLRKYGLKRVAYTTYQAVSGSGKAGLEDLERGLVGEMPTYYPHPIAFNVLPHIDSFLEDGFTKEERKMMDETRKILELPDLKVTATAVRVPVRYGHCVEINVSFEQPFHIEEIREIFAADPNIVLMDDTEKGVYPTPLAAAGQDKVYVGRIRRDPSQENALHMWCVADNVRKGAASNAVQILQSLLQ